MYLGEGTQTKPKKTTSTYNDRINPLPTSATDSLILAR